MVILRVLRKEWFLIGIICAIFFANLYPSLGCKGGPLMPEITVKYIAVSLIFFNSGLSLRSEDLASAIFQINLHLYIQIFTFVFAPFVMYVLTSLLEYSPFDKLLLQGLLVVGSMPPPVSSAVILTKAVGGNEAGAIFNSAFGSFLGILITPLWLLYFVGSSAQVSKLRVFTQLSITVVIPLLVGQVVRSQAKIAISRARIPFGAISSATLLLIIYTTFCDTFSHDDVDLDGFSLVSIILLIVVLQCALLMVSFYLSTQRFWKFQPSDVVACIFCSTHKSLTLGLQMESIIKQYRYKMHTGIPILKVLFSNHPEMSVISIPLLIYHPTQILLGGILVPTVRGWMVASTRFRYPRSINYV